MNKLQFKGEWHELKGKLRQKFADLLIKTWISPRARKGNCWATCRRSLTNAITGLPI
jgi:hypothetical protein